MSDNEINVNFWFHCSFEYWNKIKELAEFFRYHFKHDHPQYDFIMTFQYTDMDIHFHRTYEEFIEWMKKGKIITEL